MNLQRLYEQFKAAHGQEIESIYKRKYADNIIVRIPTASLGLSQDEKDAIREAWDAIPRKRKVNFIDYDIRHYSILINNPRTSIECKEMLIRERERLISERRHKESSLKVNQLRDKRIIELVKLVRLHHDKKTLKAADLYRFVAKINAARYGLDAETEQRFFKIVKNACDNAFNKGEVDF